MSLFALSRRKLLLLSIYWMVTPAHAEKSSSVTWNFGLKSQYFNYSFAGENEITGPNLAIQVNRAWLSEHWYFASGIEFISGPFESRNTNRLAVDYNGTGFQSWLAYSAGGFSRSRFHYGFAFGLHYQDLVGRTVSTRNRLSSDITLQNWVLRINDFSIQPSIYFTWLSDGKETLDNSPQSLMTRIEGYIMRLGVAIPSYSRYSLSFEENEIKNSSRGYLSGYTIFVSLESLLSA